MSLRHSLNTPYSGGFSNCIVKTLVVTLLLTCFSTLLAQEGKVNRVLVLHGGWNELHWHREFDRVFSQSLREAESGKVEISFQNFGVDKLVSPKTRAFYATSIESILVEQRIDMIVAVLPTAIEFVLDVSAIADIPKVLVLPGSNLDLTTASAGAVRVVNSNAEKAIQKTIEAASLLNPDADKVEVFSGAGQTDLAYMARAKTASTLFGGVLDFNFQSGLSVEELITRASQLGNDSLLLLLPYASFNNGEFSDFANSIPQISRLSKVPAYSISDSWLAAGIVGGYMFTVEKYAQAASQGACSLIHQVDHQQTELAVSGGFVFDYEQVARWNLNLSNLTEPYVLINQPTSIFDDYAMFIYTIVVLVFFLLLAIVFQFIMLKRSEVAKLRLEKSEKQARENQVWFELVTRNSLDVIWTWDGNRKRLTYCSSSIEQLTGYTVEEFSALPADQVMTESSVKMALEKVSPANQDAQVFEIELVTKTGEQVCCEIAAQPISESNDDSNNWVGITRDVRKRKEAEREKLGLQNQVRQAQKFESLGTLAGGIAHDFNNILGVVMGLTEVLKLKLKDNDEATQIAEKLMVTTDRAKAIVGQILAFSRQSTGSAAVSDVNELLAESFQIMRTGLPKSISLSFEKADHPVNVLGDSNQISQVFINALTNAYEAVDEQTGSISVTLFETFIETQTKLLHGELSTGCYAIVEIADNGTGLTEDEIDKMFDPFYTSKELGNGMGLAIARGIIVGHGGAVDIISQKGRGCTFLIYLPITEGEEECQEASEPKADNVRKSTIVLVDDQKDLLETFSMMLRELGHECISCADPNEAIDVLGNEDLEVDLVITDYSMPGISGLDIKQFCAKHRPLVPVVLATGYSQRVEKDELLSETPSYVMNKPFGLREVKEMLGRTLPSL